MSLLQTRINHNYLQFNNDDLFSPSLSHIELNAVPQQQFFRKKSLDFDDLFSQGPISDQYVLYNQQPVQFIQEQIHQNIVQKEKPSSSNNKLLVKAKKQHIVDKTQVSQFSCNCKKSKCLKMYCECFNDGNVCSDKCKCKNCGNTKSSEDRIKAIEEALIRNIDAYQKQPKCQKQSIKSKIMELKDDQLSCSDFFNHSSSQFNKLPWRESSEASTLGIIKKIKKS